jgi:hypothetical protein
MRCGKKTVAGGAAMLISVGAARAGQEPRVEPADRSMASARQETSENGKGGAPLDPARAKPGAAVNGDGSGYVTHDELDRFSKELIERVERARHEPTPQTFTDAG